MFNVHGNHSLSFFSRGKLIVRLDVLLLVYSSRSHLVEDNMFLPNPRSSVRRDVGQGRRRQGRCGGGGSRRRPRRGGPSPGAGREADPGAGADEADPGGEEDGAAAGAGRRGHWHHGQEHRERVSME